MPPKVQKKKAAKPQEKKAVRLKSVAQSVAEYDADEVDQQWGDEGDIGVEQLDLPAEELNKDVTIILRADNPYFSEEFVEFSFKDLEFKTLSNFPDTVTFFSQAGDVIHKSLLKTVEEKSEEEESVDDVSKRKNKFNYCDRAVQTMNLSVRHQIVQTEARAEAKLNFNATLWAITSSYGQAKKVPAAIRLKYALVDTKFRRISKDQGFDMTANFLDRMVTQNVYSDVALDFGFYDNPCDEFLGDGMGSILPLWKVTHKPMKGVAVTAISWNHRYPDLFAAAYGTTGFIHENKGCICIFTLKNTSNPEKVFDVDAAVECLDFNKLSPHLLVAGMAHGRVSVFDLRCEGCHPILTSLCCPLQHTDAVCQVKWLSRNIEEQDNFCSISSDGKVINWCIAKSELLSHKIICLKNEEVVAMGPENALLTVVNCGTTVSFNNDSTDIFIVGSEEGIIYKCSDLYSQLYLTKYEEHINTVYCVEFNPFHPRVFLSCSADWTIRIWDHSSPNSVFMFDMFTEVEAATWAPFSSTLFAAITKDGKVHVFDLLMNRQLPTCTQTIHSQMKHIPLTSVCFNPRFPVLMVGDAKGSIISYKLSPNLRSSIKGLTELERSKFIASEVDKMEKVLKLAKSPDSKEKTDT